MKKSDKLLLSIIIGFFALFGITNLSLYMRYKNGQVIRESDLFESSPLRKMMPAPGYLAVSGVGTVTLIAADRFAVEYNIEKLKPGKAALLADLEADKFSQLKEAPPPLAFTEKGDSLTISGSSTAVTIYFPSIPAIQLEDATVNVRGAAHPEGSDCRLILKNCQTRIGAEYDEKMAYLGALSVKSVKSNIWFDSDIYIRDLKLELDDTTNVEQLNCKVGKIHIEATDDAGITISGANIRKLLEGR
jgi:hypothetical protein